MNRSQNPSSGKLSLSGLQAGDYKAKWWDTQASKVITETAIKVTGTEALSLTTPEVKSDVALFITKSSDKPAKKGKEQPEKDTKPETSAPSAKPALPARGAVSL